MSNIGSEHAVAPFLPTAPGAARHAPGSPHAPPGAPPRPRLSVLAAIGWAAVIAASAYFVATKAHLLYRVDEGSYGRYWPLAVWLLPHVAAGVIALFLGPLQFATALRRRFAALHRWGGRAYVGAIAVGAAASVGLLVTHAAAPLAFRAGLAGLTLAWIATTALAVVSIRRGNVVQHREWMVRSFVVTFGFVAFRLIADGLGAADVGTRVERLAIAAWGCWALPLLVAELFIQGGKILRAPRRALPALAD